MYEIFEELCIKNNVTVYRVCKDTGITTATMSNWKAGRSTPKSDKLQKIADYFGVSLSYLMGNVDNDALAAGQRLFSWLYEHKISLDEAAQIGSVPKSFVEKVINGQVPLDAVNANGDKSHLTSFIERIGMPLFYFMGWETLEESNSQADVIQARLDTAMMEGLGSKGNKYVEMYTLFDSMDDEQKDVILQFLSAYKEQNKIPVASEVTKELLFEQLDKISTEIETELLSMSIARSDYSENVWFYASFEAYNYFQQEPPYEDCIHLPKYIDEDIDYRKIEAERQNMPINEIPEYFWIKKHDWQSLLYKYHNLEYMNTLYNVTNAASSKYLLDQARDSLATIREYTITRTDCLKEKLKK